MDKRHALLLVLGFVGGLLAGTFLSLGGRESAPPAMPPSVCRITPGVAAEQSRWRLEITRSDTNPAPGMFALTCTPTS